MEENSKDNELFNPEEMQSPFESIKEVDAEGHEWWNSRKLARLLGYMKYWNFERLMDKVATFLQQEKGLDHLKQLDETGEVHMSDAIRKIPILSDKWDEQGVMLYNLDAIIAVDYRVNSYEEAEAKALGEYEKFWRIQDKTILSDFDRFIEGLE